MSGNTILLIWTAVILLSFTCITALKCKVVREICETKRKFLEELRKANRALKKEKEGKDV